MVVNILEVISIGTNLIYVLIIHYRLITMFRNLIVISINVKYDNMLLLISNKYNVKKK